MANSTTWNIPENVVLPTNESLQKCNPYGPLTSTHVQGMMTTGYIILLTLSLTGNIFVIAVFYKRYDQLRTPVNYFIVNMAVSDLFVPLFVLPLLIKQVYLGYGTWFVGGVLGDILCRVVNLADEVSVSVSSQSMVFIAAERFSGITFPMKTPLISIRTSPRFICFTWIFSLIFFSYYLFAHKLVYKGNTSFCDYYGLPPIFDTWEDLWRADRLSVLVIFVAIPLTIFYTAIAFSLLRHKQKRCSSNLGSEVIQRREKQNRRITLMLVTVVAVFFISWTPYYVYFFPEYYSLDSNWSCVLIKRLKTSGRLMNYMYTAVNPIIYYTFIPTYRKGFHDLLRCPWPCSCHCQQGRVRQFQVTHVNTNVDSLNCTPRAEIELQVFRQRQI